jgi:hypothetical protein
MMGYFSPCIMSTAYLKRLHDDLQNDIDLDFFCQGLRLSNLNVLQDRTP